MTRKNRNLFEFLLKTPRERDVSLPTPLGNALRRRAFASGGWARHRQSLPLLAPVQGLEPLTQRSIKSVLDGLLGQSPEESGFLASLYPPDIKKKESSSREKRVFAKTERECWYCGRLLVFANHGCPGSLGAWEVDHATPVSRGGSDRIWNLWPACVDCNREKGDKTAEEYRQVRRRRFFGPRL